jgi:ribonuclease P protein component
VAGARDQGLAREQRIRRRAEFLRCYREGRRRGGRHSTLFYADGPPPDPRLGVTASRKVGKAVVRQRVRRRVREIVRRWPARDRLPELDVVIHLKNDATALGFDELRGVLEGLLERAVRGGGRRGRRR